MYICIYIRVCVYTSTDIDVCSYRYSRPIWLPGSPHLR